MSESRRELTEEEREARGAAWNERLCDGDKTDANEVIWDEAWDAARDFFAVRVVPVSSEPPSSGLAQKLDDMAVEWDRDKRLGTGYLGAVEEIQGWLSVRPVVEASAPTPDCSKLAQISGVGASCEREEKLIEELALFLASRYKAIIVRRPDEPVDVCRFHRELAQDLLTSAPSSSAPEQVERQWNVVEIQGMLEGLPVNGRQLSTNEAESLANLIVDAVRVVPVSSDGEHNGIPDSYWREMPCGHPPDPVALRNAQGTAVCHCGRGLALVGDSGLSIEGAPGPVYHCDRCGCHVAVPPAPARPVSVKASGEREAAWRRFLEDNDPEPTMAWVHLAFDTAWNARGLAAPSQVPDEAADNREWRFDQFGIIVHAHLSELAGLTVVSKSRLDAALAASRVPSAPGDAVWATVAVNSESFEPEEITDERLLEELSETGVSFERMFIRPGASSSSASEQLCGAQDWGRDEDGEVVVLGTCGMPAGHEGNKHYDFSKNEVWHEWHGRADSRAPVASAPEQVERAAIDGAELLDIECAVEQVLLQAMPKGESWPTGDLCEKVTQAVLDAVSSLPEPHEFDFVLPDGWEEHSAEELDRYARELDIDVDAIIQRDDGITPFTLIQEIKKAFEPPSGPPERTCRRCDGAGCDDCNHEGTEAILGGAAMSVIPIDEAGIKKAAAQLEPLIAAGERDLDYALAAVSAYLEAVGATIEYRGEAWDDGETESDATEAVPTLAYAERDLRVLQEDCDPPYQHTRIAACWVTPWKPLTNTEEERP